MSRRDLFKTTDVLRPVSRRAAAAISDRDQNGAVTPKELTRAGAAVQTRRIRGFGPVVQWFSKQFAKQQQSGVLHPSVRIHTEAGWVPGFKAATQDLTQAVPVGGDSRLNPQRIAEALVGPDGIMPAGLEAAAQAYHGRKGLAEQVLHKAASRLWKNFDRANTDRQQGLSPEEAGQHLFGQPFRVKTQQLVGFESVENPGVKTRIPTDLLFSPEGQAIIPKDGKTVIEVASANPGEGDRRVGLFFDLGRGKGTFVPVGRNGGSVKAPERSVSVRVGQVQLDPDAGIPEDRSFKLKLRRDGQGDTVPVGRVKGADGKQYPLLFSDAGQPLPSTDPGAASFSLTRQGAIKGVQGVNTVVFENPGTVTEVPIFEFKPQTLRTAAAPSAVFTLNYQPQQSPKA